MPNPSIGTYPPGTFILVPKSELSKRHFDTHPIWSEYYDFEEREEIVSWGVDRAWLDSELERLDTGGEHCAYPILRPHPLPDRMRLFIKAQFRTAGGSELTGYVMNEDAFVITLFSGDREFVFSRHPALADMNTPSFHGLRQYLNQPDDPIFPIQYKTEFVDRDERLIEGSFTAATIAKPAA